MSLRIEAVSLREQVVDKIRQAILEGQIKPGDRIYEEQLSETMGVSRTPVREGLVILEHEGLVEILLNRGCYVKELSKQDIEEIFPLRCQLETLAAEMAVQHGIVHEQIKIMEQMLREQQQLDDVEDYTTAGKLDFAFHEYLVSLSRNAHLQKTWRIHYIQCGVAYSYFVNRGTKEARHQIMLNDHKRIIQRFRERDFLGIKALFKEISDRVIQECLIGFDIINNAPDY
jgi:DNA-binding GntR family transcriptional regulator